MEDQGEILLRVKQFGVRGVYYSQQPREVKLKGTTGMVANVRQAMCRTAEH